MRTIYAILIAVSLIAGIAGCAKEESTDYFPLTEGAKWNYKAEYQGFDGFISVKAASKIKLDQGEGTVLEYQKDSSTDEPYNELYEKREWGIYAYKRVHPIINNIETTMDPPEPFLKLPLKVGETWKWEGRIFGLKSSSEFKVESEEVINVGNKRYNAFKVLEKGSSEDGRALVSYRWYAAGFGLVKEESTMILGKEETDRSTRALM